MKFKNTGKLKTTEEILEELNSIFGQDTYDFSELVYKGVDSKSYITCLKCGTRYYWTIRSLKLGRKCSCQKTIPNKKTNEQYLEDLESVYGDKLQYHLALYKGAKEPVTVICNTCSEEFSQEASYLLKGNGCPHCNIKQKLIKLTSNTKEFIDKAKRVHGDKFNYSLVNYIRANKDVDIICPKGHIFSQTPNNHLAGKGCRYCKYELTVSAKEQELADYIKSLGVDVIQSYRPNWFLLEGNKYPSEIDIFIPSLNLGIEYNGLAHHHSTLNSGIAYYDNSYVSPNYHLSKYKVCLKNNIKLIHIFEFENFDDWLNILSEYVKEPSKFDIQFTNIKRQCPIRKSLIFDYYGESKVTLKDQF